MEKLIKNLRLELQRLDDLLGNKAFSLEDKQELDERALEIIDDQEELTKLVVKSSATICSGGADNFKNIGDLDSAIHGIGWNMRHMKEGIEKIIREYCKQNNVLEDIDGRGIYVKPSFLMAKFRRKKMRIKADISRCIKV